MSAHRLADVLRDYPVVVTGVGAFSAAGDSAAALWAAAAAGRSLAATREYATGAGPVRFTTCAAPAIDPARPELRPVRKMDRCVQMALLAAGEAWRQAGMANVHAPERVGVMVGSSRGPLRKRAESLADARGRTPAPSVAVDTTFASVSGAVARAFGCKGSGAMVSATCTSAAYAIAFAAEQIVLGHADAMLVGGTEAPLDPTLLAQLQAAGVLGFHEEPERTCRPFDLSRNGMVLGEGSAFLVLESALSAAARRATVLARLEGWATGIHDSGRTGIDPRGSGLVRVMQQALQVAGLSPEHVDYINAHGTGTQINDAAEAQAVSALFGELVPCTSTKPVTGHCLGATPALESVISIEALLRQIIPPTANCQVQDPLCRINLLPLNARRSKVRTVMSNSLGFWGYHASLIFGVY